MSETALDIQPQETTITKQDVRKYLCEKATDKEIELFLITCKLHGLNPLKREAYLIKYGSSPAQTVVGYETYLKRAEATGLLNGWECTADDESASIIIHRKDREYPFKWTIERKEFDKKVAMWNAMPRHMLKKTVISVGFRLCFPETLGGMPYTKEEMEGTGEGAKELETPPETPKKAPRKPPEKTSRESNPPVPDLEKEPTEKPQNQPLTRKMMEGSIRSMVAEMKNNNKNLMIAYMQEVYGKDFIKLDVLDDQEIELTYNTVLKDYNEVG